ncbi:response regulator transcription factor [bacterium]|nr:response regulator transcription factor [bacterium]
MKILLIEDHVMTRLGTAMVIKQVENFELVAEAGDGESGINLARKFLPDVILMDIGLPKLDGIEATKKLKQELNIGSGILMFTSRDNRDDVFSALKAGADGYIMKGSSPETLINAINAIGSGASWLDPQIARLVLSSIQEDEEKQETQEELAKPQDKKENNKYGLTRRELEVLSLIVEGLSNPEISERLVVSLATTKAHVHSILQKLYIQGRAKAAVFAVQEGLV